MAKGFARLSADEKQDLIEVGGAKYSVMPFTDNLLRRLLLCIQQEGRDWVLGDFDAQSEAAKVIKEVICPDLPDAVIYRTKRGLYVFGLAQLEIIALMMKITKAFFVRELRQSRDSGDEKAVAFLVEKVAYYNKLLSQMGTPSFIQGFMEQERSSEEIHQELQQHLGAVAQEPEQVVPDQEVTG